MIGASLVSADDVNRGSTSLNRPRNLAISVRKQLIVAALIDRQCRVEPVARCVA